MSSRTSSDSADPVTARTEHLSGLARLDGLAMRKYDQADPEEYAAVAEVLRHPLPRVSTKAAAKAAPKASRV